MNKHMRLVVSVLFIVIILLAVAITRFYSDTTKSPGSGGSQPAVAKMLDADSAGNRIFEDSSGLFGIADSSDRILVSPEWKELSFASSGICTASQRIKGKDLCGCIDYEGNVTVPFIYSSISRRTIGEKVIYIAQASADSSCVVYDENFVPCFSRAWKGFLISGDDIVLNTDKGVYTYSAGSEDFILKSAEISDEAGGNPYIISISSRIILSRLTVQMLESISSDVGRYIEYAFSGDSEHLSGIRSAGVAVFTPLFPDDENITSRRLMGISDVYLYSVRSEDNIPHYAVSVTADTEISYKDEKGRTKKLRDDCKAVVEFRGSSANDLAAVSGSFLQEAPEYPQPETEPTSEPATDTVPGTEQTEIQQPHTEAQLQ